MSALGLTIYVHPDGTAEFREPIPPDRIIVGPLFTAIDRVIYFTPGWPLDRIKALSGERKQYRYHQKQLPFYAATHETSA